MVYVFRSFSKNNLSVLKIGYSEDNNFNKRAKTYFSYCYFRTGFIFTIPGGTMEHESKLHYYFQDYRLSGEWFLDSPVITNFFEAGPGISELDRLPSPKDDIKFNKTKLEFRKLLSYFFESSDDIEFYLDKVTRSFTNSSKQLTIDLALEYLENDPNISKDKVDNYKKVMKRLTNELSYVSDLKEDKTIRDHVRRVMSSSLFYDKLEYILNLSDSKLEKLIIDQLGFADPVRKYYLEVGADRLRGILQKKKLLSEVEIQKELAGDEGLIESIQDRFSVGEILTLSEVNNRIREVYEEFQCDIPSNPLDILESLFIVKTLFDCGDGKKYGILREKGEVGMKLKKTYSLLKVYQDSTEEESKRSLLEVYAGYVTNNDSENSYISIGVKINDDGSPESYPYLNRLLIEGDLEESGLRRLGCSSEATPVVIPSLISSLVKEYQSLSSKEDKIKFISKVSNTYQECITSFLDLISDSDKAKTYYLSLLKKYQIKSFDDRHKATLIDIQVLENAIYEEFKEGDEILLADIKKRLTIIYSDINYDKNPVATDILEFFEAKESFFTVTTSEGKKKRSKGFKLLKKKF